MLAAAGKTPPSIGRIGVRTFLVAAALCILQVSMATAKDFKPIAEFIRPAYSAMNLALLCARDDPWFLADTSGPRGNAIKYAMHVRDEAIASLSKDEAMAVLKLAADEARNEAREELRKIVPTQTYRYPQIAGWCRSYVLRVVRGVIEKHDAEHTPLLRRLAEEKQKLRSAVR